ncbi:MAG: glycoside hydrolase family 38 C-terminal domain-containing protein, partial [Pseudomonadota bacterium]
MATHSLTWTVQKISKRLQLIEPLQYRKRHAIAPFRYLPLADAKVAAPVGLAVDDQSWAQIEPDSYWGDWAQNFCMRTWFEVPDGFDRNKPIALHLPLGVAGDIFCHPEALAYVDGQAYVSTDRYHHEIMLTPDMAGGQTHLLALHGWTGLSGWPPDPNAKTKLFMRECAVVEIDEPTRAFVMLTRVALDFAKRLDQNHASRNHLLSALDAAYKVLDTRDPVDDGRLYETVPAALETLQAGIDEAKHSHHLDIIAVGHAHIDIAYLWQVEQARQKSARTFSNVLHLMERYPDYHFSQSQPQLYQYLESDYPDIFDRIKDKVAEGRWELLGGMWVEPDCSLTGPESLVRQILLGRRYFSDKFGEEAETPCLWLPDTFGFAWSLPQLMKQAGLKWFVTNKLNWNQYNHMPFQIFQWQGIDGTKVLAHLLTTPRPVQYLPFATTYKAELTADEVIGTWENFKQKGDHHELIVAYGYGDGGGGPTRELIETAGILKDMPGAPTVRPGTVKEFFEGIETSCAADLPVWNGELYLELHRGTLTSESRTKRNNRKSEFVLHDTEFLSAFAAMISGFTYPHDDLTECWERVCLNQFHDILPGTAIEEVFQDAERDYLFVRETLEKIRENAIGHLALHLPEQTAAIAINPSPFSADRVGYLPGANVPQLKSLVSGQTLPMQKVYGGTLINLPASPSYGVQALGVSDSDTLPPGEFEGVTVTQSEDGTIEINSPLLEVSIGTHGELTRVYDKQAARDAIKPGETANQLLVFEDRPMTWDAWDIDVFYEDRAERITDLQKIEIIEEGPLRVSVLIERKYRSSTIRHRVCVYAHTKRI